MSIPQKDDFDDGLVHSHNWASSERNRPALVNRPPEPDFDDGLVHGHNWASAERSREAHRT